METALAVSDVASPQRLMITQMDLENFKSYAGVITIGPFDKNMTSVVGPNGSGKSNVIDAMLFVFGFRAKQMRQAKVSELIHSSEQVRLGGWGASTAAQTPTRLVKPSAWRPERGYPTPARPADHSVLVTCAGRLPGAPPAGIAWHGLDCASPPRSSSGAEPFPPPPCSTRRSSTPR